MMNQVFDSTTKAGTASGTLLSIFANINSGDVLKTAILAAIGAVVSFSVTLLLKLLVKQLKK
jgi:mannitol-specific phosphotransferase system IIBC component